MHKKTWPVGIMCRVMGVTSSGYYSYQKRKRIKTDHDPDHVELLDWVKQISVASKFTYGSRRIRMALNALGFPVGRRKTRSLMREANVFVRYRKKYKVTTNSNHKQPVFENVLNRQFQVSEPNRAYVSDITAERSLASLGMTWEVTFFLITPLTNLLNRCKIRTCSLRPIQRSNMDDKYSLLGCRQAVRHWVLIPACPGSNPGTPATHKLLRLPDSHITTRPKKGLFICQQWWFSLEIPIRN